MNRFLAGSRVLEVEQKFYQNTNGACWSFCVRYLISNAGSFSTQSNKQKVDYKALLNENDLAISQKQVVFIFDEAHRSQFGETQRNLKKKFKKYYQFGFTAKPIFGKCFRLRVNTLVMAYFNRSRIYVCNTCTFSKSN